MHQLIIITIFHAAAPGAYLLFANIFSLVQLQNVPTLRINTYGNVGSRVVAVDFDKRYYFMIIRIPPIDVGI